MIITYHGHAEFCLETAKGFTLLFDPFDDHVGYKMGEYVCDAALISHGHGDHNFTGKLKGDYTPVKEAGKYQLAEDVQVIAIPSAHDELQGLKRGPNLIMKVMAEDLSVVHLGDQGALLTEEQLGQIGHVDVLMVPVGGFFTIDAAQAKQIVEQLKPWVVIPMHYKTKVNPDWPISDEKPFLQLMGKEELQPMPLIRITKGDLSQQPDVAMLQYE